MYMPTKSIIHAEEKIYMYMYMLRKILHMLRKNLRHVEKNLIHAKNLIHVDTENFKNAETQRQ